MQIGAGEFWHGDCMSLLTGLPDECVDCIVTDPPYRTISGGPNGAPGYGWRASVVSKNDGKLFKHNDVRYDEYLPSFYRLMKPSSHLYLMTNNLNLRDCLNAIERHGFHFHNLLRWDKNNRTANRWYMKDCEYTVFATKRPAKPINSMSATQGFKCDNPRNKRHPTEKPVELMQHYIENSTQLGDLVLDPFAGCGTTAVAAERAGRRWLCIETDPQYYYPAVGRIWGEVTQ